MKTRHHLTAFGAAFAVYAAMGAAAVAQPTQGPRGQSAPPHAHAPGAESPSQRAARLRDALQLRPAQEPALQAYVAALGDAHPRMEAPPGPRPATTPERLDRMERMMAEHQRAGQAVIAATRRFYDQLDAAQKRAFDAMPMRMDHHGDHGMMMGDMHKPGGGDHLHHAPPPR